MKLIYKLPYRLYQKLEYQLYIVHIFFLFHCTKQNWCCDLCSVEKFLDQIKFSCSVIFSCFFQQRILQNSLTVFSSQQSPKQFLSSAEALWFSVVSVVGYLFSFWPWDQFSQRCCSRLPPAEIKIEIGKAQVSIRQDELSVQVLLHPSVDTLILMEESQTGSYLSVSIPLWNAGLELHIQMLSLSF